MTETITHDEIKNKITSRSQAIEFCQKLGNISICYYKAIFSLTLECMTLNIFIYSFKIKRKYHFFSIISQLIPLGRHGSVKLPNYFISDELQKDKLLKLCLNNPILKDYLPDLGDLEAIQRNFLLTVSLKFMNLVNSRICRR